MATFDEYTDIATIQAAPTTQTLLGPTQAGGKVRFVVAKYTPTGDEDAGSTVKICRLPKGAHVLQHLSAVAYTAGQDADLAVAIGDDDAYGVGAAADADRYMVAIATLATANTQPFSALANIAAANWVTPYKTGSECWLIATTSVRQLNAAAIYFWIAYLID